MVDKPKKVSEVIHFDELAFLKDENQKLKNQLKSLAKMVPKSTFAVSDEQSICEIEISRLRDTALTRPLSLEETKKLDILVKNLNSSRKDQIIDINPADKLSITELLKLVTNDPEESK